MEWETHGEVYTRRWVVETILDLVGYTSDRSLREMSLLEPSVGSGAFLIPVVERLLDSCEGDFSDLSNAVRAYDLLPASIERSKAAVFELLSSRGIPTDDAINLCESWLHTGDFLLESGIETADFVVGNPPYIRIEDIPVEITAAYRAAWSTMQGRADIYVGFYERGLGLLNPGGKLGFICADRWMRNQYGGALRDFVTQSFSVDHVWVMHDVDAFESQVCAYPAITVISNRPQGIAIAAEASAAFNQDNAFQLSAWADSDSMEPFTHAAVEASKLTDWFEGPDMWPSGSPQLIALMEKLNENFPTLQDPVTGTRVGIGVASGADKTYIVKEAPVETERLLPLSMVGDLKPDGRFTWGENYLVNPWNTDGSLVDLNDYPRLKTYLETAEGLRERHTAKKNPSGWYRTIDKVNAELIEKPKLLIQDMRATINPVLEKGGYYPHHNLYFVTSESWDLEVLGGILISRIGQAFIEAYGVRMRGGTLRFQAQYLKKIRLPMLEFLNDDVAQKLRNAFRTRNIEQATLAAADAYGIEAEEYGLINQGEAA